MDAKDKGKLAAMLGARIAAIRLDRDMTQAQLAEALGIGEEAVSRIERGAVTPTLPRLFDIAEALNHRTDELISRASPRVDDQAMAVAHLIAQLVPADRDFVIDSVERLAHYLRLRAPEKRTRR